MLKRHRWLVMVVGLAVLIGLGAGCTGGESDAAKQRRDAIEHRADSFDQARRLYPEPQTKNFPLRRALVEFTERQDLLNHPWYVYVLADTGNVVGYYVAKTVPINACNFLSSTEDVYTSENGNLRMTAPSLDGIFYGGGGTSAGCDAWFFFDAATNALIQIRGVHFFTADQPLRLDAQPIEVVGR